MVHRCCQAEGPGPRFARLGLYDFCRSCQPSCIGGSPPGRTPRRSTSNEVLERVAWREDLAWREKTDRETVGITALRPSSWTPPPITIARASVAFFEQDHAARSQRGAQPVQDLVALRDVLRLPGSSAGTMYCPVTANMSSATREMMSTWRSTEFIPRYQRPTTVCPGRRRQEQCRQAPRRQRMSSAIGPRYQPRVRAWGSCRQVTGGASRFGILDLPRRWCFLPRRSQLRCRPLGDGGGQGTLRSPIAQRHVLSEPRAAAFK